MEMGITSPGGLHHRESASDPKDTQQLLFRGPEDSFFRNSRRTCTRKSVFCGSLAWVSLETSSDDPHHLHSPDSARSDCPKLFCASSDRMQIRSNLLPPDQIAQSIPCAADFPAAFLQSPAVSQHRRYCRWHWLYLQHLF